MNHNDWLQLIIGLLTTITSFFAAHSGGKKGASSE